VPAWRPVRIETGSVSWSVTHYFVPARRLVTETLLGVLSASQIARDGPNLLLFRSTNGPVFSISPAAKVRVHRLKVEGDYRLYRVKADQNSWIVEFLHDVAHSLTEEVLDLCLRPWNRSSTTRVPLAGKPGIETSLHGRRRISLSQGQRKDPYPRIGQPCTRSKAKLEQRHSGGDEAYV
jgi:hypothetical protein